MKGSDVIGKIIQQKGHCTGIVCKDCPFGEYYKEGDYWVCDPHKIMLIAAKAVRSLEPIFDEHIARPIDFACTEMMCEREAGCD